MFLRMPVFQVIGAVLLSQFFHVWSLPEGRSGDSFGLSLTVVQYVPGPHNLENLAVRHNGDILLTSVSSSSLYQVSPTKSHPPISIAEIPSVFGLLGIAELEKDVFYVIGSNISGLSVAPGSNGVWKVDIRDFSATENGTVSQPARVSMVTMVPPAKLFNGMCRLAPNDTSNLLIADSTAGTITKLNVDTGVYEVVIQDTTMTILPTGLAVGVNGIHTHKSKLFFTSLNRGFFATVPISLSTGTATGPVEVIVNGTAGDDFALSRNGSKAWIAMNGQNTLVEVDVPGKTAHIVANSTLLMSDTSVAFGRTRFDQNSLYITGVASVNDTTVGSLLRVDLPDLKLSI